MRPLMRLAMLVVNRHSRPKRLQRRLHSTFSQDGRSRQAYRRSLSSLQVRNLWIRIGQATRASGRDQSGQGLGPEPSFGPRTGPLGCRAPQERQAGVRIQELQTESS